MPNDSQHSAAPPFDEAQQRLGTRLGNYALKEIIGHGGMGVVYRGQHIYIRKQVAVKVMYNELFANPLARKQFLQEAQAASLIDHPNVVAVSDFGEAPDGTVFLVMSLVEGRSMEDLLVQSGPLPLFRTLVILSQVARGLGAAHGQNVVHRDLKPENIMLHPRRGRREIIRTEQDARGSIDYVEPEKEFDFATVLDFGAATIRSPFDNKPKNDTVIATPYYMAPETAYHGHADGRSDVYALGVIFYRALTGTLPFEGDDPQAIMRAHVYDDVQPPRARNPHVEITAEAERVIMKALSKDPMWRHQTMEELYADLQRCFGRVRFRRINNTSEDEFLSDGHIDGKVTPNPTVRPVPLLRAKPKTDLPASDPRQSVVGRARTISPGGTPLLLTKTKAKASEMRHGTLPFGVATPTPDPVLEMQPERHRTWPMAMALPGALTPCPEDV